MAAALCGNDHSRELIDRCRKRGLPGAEGAERARGGWHKGVAGAGVRTQY